jgi:hypothetical protein
VNGLNILPSLLFHCNLNTLHRFKMSCDLFDDVNLVLMQHVVATGVMIYNNFLCKMFLQRRFRFPFDHRLELG